MEKRLYWESVWQNAWAYAKMSRRLEVLEPLALLLPVSDRYIAVGHVALMCVVVQTDILSATLHE